MSANALSNEQAVAMVQAAEMNFGSGNVPAILAGLTDDVVIQFADVPEIHGKTDAEKFLNARFSRQKNYQLKKTMRMLQGNMVGNFWAGTWEDAQTGRRMAGRGTEFWTVVDGRVKLWEATFNVWDADAGPKPAVL
ncbi:MAG: hypothetical protein FD157_3639 [Rhodocyclaceae bacterium]|nr:MAG: hypothetical protein FD157_3639 [Rhodocyclaceae bacterium]TND01512.1 MAG: hypothetical protein FD118_2333 [Rhodocyclaceae bacterium]